MRPNVTATRCFVCLAAAAMSLGASAPAEFGKDRTLRLATFNIKELTGAKLGDVDESGRGRNVQLRKAAEIIRRVRPDILLINEIDHDGEHRGNAALFRDRYLEASQAGSPPIDYPHIFFAPVNTGVPTGLDLDHDGRDDGPNDAYGFGRYPGEYGMALLSRFPIDEAGARTLQRLLWKDMPGHLMPDGNEGRPPYYSPEQARILRLSSKSHWDVPVRVFDRTLHILAAHPTPPIFDGPEDRNGRRNHDEIRLWADYISAGSRADYIVDDRGSRGGLKPGSLFVIMGDLNSDPDRMEAHAAWDKPAIRQLLDHPRVQDPRPRSPGSAIDAEDYPGDKAARTNHFGRIDYVLPCRELPVVDARVFWPSPGDPTHTLIGEPDPASDHYLVWIDVRIP